MVPKWSIEPTDQEINRSATAWTLPNGAHFHI